MTDDDKISPEELAALGAAVDQARQEFINMVDALVAVARKKGRPGDPLAMPAAAMAVKRALEAQFPDDSDVQLYYAINMLAETATRLAHPEQTVQK